MSTEVVGATVDALDDGDRRFPREWYLLIFFACVRSEKRKRVLALVQLSMGKKSKEAFNDNRKDDEMVGHGWG